MRVDFGADIRFPDEKYDLSHLFPESAESDNHAGEKFVDRYKLASRGYAIGTITYSDGKVGTIIYVKSTLTRFLPGDLYGYKARNDDFRIRRRWISSSTRNCSRHTANLGIALRPNCFGTLKTHKSAPESRRVRRCQNRCRKSPPRSVSSAAAAGNTAPA